MILIIINNTLLLKKGMTELINLMINDIKNNKNVKLVLNTKITNVFFENNFIS